MKRFGNCANSKSNLVTVRKLDNAYQVRLHTIPRFTYTGPLANIKVNIVINRYNSIAIVFISCLLIEACTENVDDRRYDVDLEITNLSCFPNDSIALRFHIEPSGGKAPYYFQWINPDTMTGAGPISMNIKCSIVLEVDVVDSEGTKVNFQFEIIKDTIDSLKYDYRNPFIGKYSCGVELCQTSQDSNGVFVTKCSADQDTLHVSKQQNFEMLQITSFPEVRFYAKDNAFLGYHTYAEFMNDSIYLSYYISPVQLIRWTYAGSKMEN